MWCLTNARYLRGRLLLAGYPLATLSWDDLRAVAEVVATDAGAVDTIQPAQAGPPDADADAARYARAVAAGATFVDI